MKKCFLKSESLCVGLAVGIERFIQFVFLTPLAVGIQALKFK